MSNKTTATLKNWQPYLTSLYGDVYGHSNFEDGISVVTSKIISVAKISDIFIVETRNTVYMCMFEDVHKNLCNYSVDELWEQLQKTVDNENL